MARQARLRSNTDIYHVIMRGNNKSDIFKEERFKLYFMETLFLVESEEDLTLLAWCVMDNHIHLVVKVAIEEFERVFKRINVRFAGYYHKRTQTVGHVFQGRPKSLPLESEGSLVNNIRYVHNNPVKSKMVEKAGDYSWSSYKRYLTGSLNESMMMVKDIIGANSFESFHQEDDEQIYLEIKEEQEAQRERLAQKVMENVRRKYGVIDSRELQKNKLMLAEIVENVTEKTGYSLRKTAMFLGISHGLVRGMLKK